MCLCLLERQGFWILSLLPHGQSTNECMKQWKGEIYSDAWSLERTPAPDPTGGAYSALQTLSLVGRGEGACCKNPPPALDPSGLDTAVLTHFLFHSWHVCAHYKLHKIQINVMKTWRASWVTTQNLGCWWRNRVILRSFASTQYQRVTDRRTDRRTDLVYQSRCTLTREKLTK